MAYSPHQRDQHSVSAEVSCWISGWLSGWWFCFAMLIPASLNQIRSLKLTVRTCKMGGFNLGWPLFRGERFVLGNVTKVETENHWCFTKHLHKIQNLLSKIHPKENDRALGNKAGYFGAVSHSQPCPFKQRPAVIYPDEKTQPTFHEILVVYLEHHPS